MKRILVERGEVTRMARLFNCSDQAVRNSLRGFVESELADRIIQSIPLAKTTRKGIRQKVKPATLTGFTKKTGFPLKIWRQCKCLQNRMNPLLNIM
jgi:hypothetical protein